MVLEKDGGLARALCGGRDRRKWTDLGGTVEVGLIRFIHELMGRRVKTSENQNDFFASGLGPGRCSGATPCPDLGSCIPVGLA